MNYNYDMERAMDLGTAIGTIRAALILHDIGMHDRAIKNLREALAKLTARHDERQRAMFANS